MEIQNQYEFKTKELIGTGSNGSRVYKLKHKQTHKVFALKKVYISSTNRKECLNEAMFLKQITHPNIICHYESFVKNDKLYLILEYAVNGDLRNVITKHKKESKAFKESEIISYMQQITKALQYIHSKNILHRDIKPENFFICEDGTLKLGDFGISKQLTESISFANTGLGTPYYVSPEICKGLNYNHKSDIWSLGCLLYELLTLRRPFEYKNINSLMYNIVNSEPPHIENENGVVYSSELIKLAFDMLSKEMESRPNINEVISQLKRIENCSNNAYTKNKVNDDVLMNFYIRSNSTKIHLIDMSDSPTTSGSNRNSQENTNTITNSNNNSGHLLILSPLKRPVVFNSKMFTGLTKINNNKEINNKPIKLSSTSLCGQNEKEDEHNVNNDNECKHEIRKKKTMNDLPIMRGGSFEQKIKKRFYSKDGKVKRRNSQENRKELMTCFLKDKYGKEMFGKILNIINRKEITESHKENELIALLSENEYKKNEKYFKYISIN